MTANGNKAKDYKRETNLKMPHNPCKKHNNIAIQQTLKNAITKLLQKTTPQPNCESLQLKAENLQWGTTPRAPRKTAHKRVDQ